MNSSGMPFNDDMLYFMQKVDIENIYVLKQRNKERKQFKFYLLHFKHN